MRQFLTLAILTILLGLSGCGQKGPLYLPSEEQPQNGSSNEE